MKFKQKNNEKQLRHRLGIPDDAKQVLVFSESSHWDPNWLLKSEEYFERFVRHNLNSAIEELIKEPKRIYSIECIFFLRLYWERYPKKQEIVRELVNSKRLRLTSSGVTTADTILPNTEAILRDLVIGQEWLRENGITQETNLAYFADSFGCTPALPSLIKAAGFECAAITRVDGMYFMGCDLEPKKRFPRQNSTAEQLLIKERSLDFVWRDMNGAQVLCHWNAFTYGQGDMLAYIGASRVYLFRVAFSARSDHHIAYRIKQYVKKLSNCSRTPYMLCPIGFDFVEPIPDLVVLLDRYNQNHYPKTGVWAINAGMDDYLALVGYYKDKLPVLQLDPNPYWTGFYTARPVLKRQCRKLVDNLLLAEKLSFLPDNDAMNKTISSKLKDAWWQAAVSNHHDFIAGTSPDRVVEEEQMPMLAQAADSVELIIDRSKYDSIETDVQKSSSESLVWTQKNGIIQIKTMYYDIKLDKNRGGTIIHFKSHSSKTQRNTEVSAELVSYRDSGGLWRMGFEFAGGIWKESMKASIYSENTQIKEHSNGLEIIGTVKLNGEAIVHRMWFVNDSPVIYCRSEGMAAKKHSVTVRFKTSIFANSLAMDSPGGVVVRPPKRIYNPTFWPYQSFVHLQDDSTEHGIAFLAPLPGAISYQPDGQIELVAMRNATKEKIFGFIAIPGNPAHGHERESYTFEYAFLFTQKGDWRDNKIHLKAHSIGTNPWSSSIDTCMSKLADSIVTTNTPDVWVAAVKPASRGKGIIVRLNAYSLSRSRVQVVAHHFTVKKAFLCDVRERDIKSLEVINGNVQFEMLGTVTTIRLM